MASEVFNALLKERIDIFKSAFSSVSTEVFYDQITKRLRHTGEYGTFREAIVRDFLKFVVPRSLDLSTGFVITSMNDVSTQCDIVIFDSSMTPLYVEGDRQRFFPIESIFCIGEVKSTLGKSQFADALNKLAKIKILSERISHPTIIRKGTPGPFDPLNNPNDLVPSILICQKLDFDISNLETEIDAMYDSSIEHRHKHNLILSIDDGVLAYASEGGFLPYSSLAGINLKHQLFRPTEGGVCHIRAFAMFVFMITASKTLFYPEISDYLGSLDGRSLIQS
ncbi:DUF6602 domain-containing protein [Pseudomonas sp. 22526]|uniref:DUF6602 domain-containing protein n=1 Tax=Pseudomonas sp. 22526 TaxID=3453937 RepID=UPI003F880219